MTFRVDELLTELLTHLRHLSLILLPNGIHERGVLAIGSIPVAIFTSNQYVRGITL